MPSSTTEPDTVEVFPRPDCPELPELPQSGPFGSVPSVKVTELRGYYATNDYESMCFSPIGSPGERMDYLEKHFTNPLDTGNTDEEWAAWQVLEQPLEAARKSLEVHPHVLFPEASKERKGRWCITVEFYPEED